MRVSAKYCLRASHPNWLEDVVAAVEAVPEDIFFDKQGQAVKTEVSGLDSGLHSALTERLRHQGIVEKNVKLWRPERQFDIDFLLPTVPKTLFEIEKGQLPRLELDVIKILSAILSRPGELGYGCLVVPSDFIELKLADGYTPYQYLVEHLVPLSRPLTDIRNSVGEYLVKDLCVLGYHDPRNGSTTMPRAGRIRGGSAIKYVLSDSKCYAGKPYAYWWDIKQEKRVRIAEAGGICFRQKDMGKRCEVQDRRLLPRLQTTGGRAGLGNRGE